MSEEDGISVVDAFILGGVRILDEIMFGGVPVGTAKYCTQRGISPEAVRKLLHSAHEQAEESVRDRQLNELTQKLLRRE